MPNGIPPIQVPAGAVAGGTGTMSLIAQGIADYFKTERERAKERREKVLDDMAQLINFHGKDVVNMPQFQDLYKEWSGQDWPTKEKITPAVTKKFRRMPKTAPAPGTFEEIDPMARFRAGERQLEAPFGYKEFEITPEKDISQIPSGQIREEIISPEIREMVPTPLGGAAEPEFMVNIAGQQMPASVAAKLIGPEGMRNLLGLVDPMQAARYKLDREKFKSDKEYREATTAYRAAQAKAIASYRRAQLEISRGNLERAMRALDETARHNQISEAIAGGNLARAYAALEEIKRHHLATEEISRTKTKTATLDKDVEEARKAYRDAEKDFLKKQAAYQANPKNTEAKKDMEAAELTLAKLHLRYIRLQQGSTQYLGPEEEEIEEEETDMDEFYKVED